MTDRATRCDDAELDPGKDPTMQANEPTGPRLLAIDDSTLIHRLLKSRLKHERLEIHTVTTGEAGLDASEALNPDVILLDLDLPDMSGFDVLHALKANPATHDIPVIFVSGCVDTTMKVRGLEMGAIDFVSKPFDLAELKARIRSAVRICTLIKMLAQRARIDGMTGLWNRTYFDERLHEEVQGAVRNNTPLSLIFCDIDHFKALNDKYGHTYGDFVLEEFANLISTGRETDIACRYGGEEFVIILPNTTASEAARVAERRRERIGEHYWEPHENLKVTASFGVSELAITGTESMEALVESADEALYAAKQAGRDRVIVGERSSAAEPPLRYIA